MTFDRELTPSGPGAITPFARLDDVLIDHAASLREALDDCFVGVYTLGSLAIGNFDLTSDVDFMVVTSRPIRVDELDRVQAAHSELLARDTRWVKHLEYSIFPVPELDRPSSPYSTDGTRTWTHPASSGTSATEAGPLNDPTTTTRS